MNGAAWRSPGCRLGHAAKSGPSQSQVAGPTLAWVQDHPEDVPEPSASLLVRRAGSDPGGLARLSSLTSGRDLGRLAALGGLFVLADLAAEPSAAPIAAAAFEEDRDSRRAHLVFFSASLSFAPRMLEGAFTLLRSDGIELVEANAGETDSVLLERLGFRKGPGANVLHWL